MAQAADQTAQAADQTIIFPDRDIYNERDEVKRSIAERFYIFKDMQSGGLVEEAGEAISLVMNLESLGVGLRDINHKFWDSKGKTKFDLAPLAVSVLLSKFRATNSDQNASITHLSKAIFELLSYQNGGDVGGATKFVEYLSEKGMFDEALKVFNTDGFNFSYKDLLIRLSTIHTEDLYEVTLDEHGKCEFSKKGAFREDQKAQADGFINLAYNILTKGGADVLISFCKDIPALENRDAEREQLLPLNSVIRPLLAISVHQMMLENSNMTIENLQVLRDALLCQGSFRLYEVEGRCPPNPEVSKNIWKAILLSRDISTVMAIDPGLVDEMLVAKYGPISMSDVLKALGDSVTEQDGVYRVLTGDTQIEDA